MAVPFWEHSEVAKALPSWEGRTVIDATNAFGEELDGIPSSAVIAKASSERAPAPPFFAPPPASC